MKSLYLLLITIFLAAPSWAAQIPIGSLPLGNASTAGSSDSFPYVDAGSNTTKRLTLFDLPNLTPFQTEFQTLIPDQTGQNGKCLTSNGTNTGWSSCSASAGTVTSVGMSVPTWLTVSGSPVTSSGTLAVTATSGLTGNFFLATPNGATGALSPRAIVASDIPTLNQNTSGTAAGLSATLAVGSGGTGATSFTSGAPLLGAGTSPVTVGSLSGNTTVLGTTSGSLTNGHCAQFDANGNLVDAGAACGTGGGSVTTLSVVSANGLAGTVANATTTPAITLTTTVSGLVKGNGTAFSAATSGTDYAPATSGSAILKGNGSGGFSSAVASTDYVAATTGSAIQKANGSGGLTAAVSATDYAPATTGSSILKASSGGFANAVSGTDYAPATSGSLPLFGNGSGGFTNGSVTGNTTKLASSTGSLTSGNCAKWDASGNVIDAGAACGTGSGTVTTTGSPASGNLAKFSGATSVTNGDLSGDITTSGTLAATLATVNSNTGSFGSSTAIPNFTVNGKGLITAAGSTAVIAPAGTLTGTTLASNVVTSSLTTVGTIGTGVWNGTPLLAAYIPSDVAYYDVAQTWSQNQSINASAWTRTVTNAGTTGTTSSKLAKLNSSGNAVITSTSDTEGAIGVVVSGAGTAGNAQIMTMGQAACISDNTTVVGDYATISSSVAGDCHDAGATYPTSLGQVVGIFTEAGAAGAHTLYALLGPALTHIAASNLTNGVTGSGSVVLATSPTLTTPTLGVATVTSINKMAVTAPATSSTLAVADGKTATISNTLTFAGTDSSTLNVGAGGTLGTCAFQGGARTQNAQTGTTYTFVLSDSSQTCTNPLVSGNNASTQTFTIPPHSSVAYPAGAQIDVCQLGAGKITLAAGAGVTLNSLGSNKSTNGQYVCVSAWQTTTQDTWILVGNLQP